MPIPQSKSEPTSLLGSHLLHSRSYFIGITLLFGLLTLIAWVDWFGSFNASQTQLSMFSTTVKNPEQRLPRLAGKPNHITAFGDDAAMLVGDGGLILRSDDGGYTWRRQSLPQELQQPEYLVQRINAFQNQTSSLTFTEAGPTINRSSTAKVVVQDTRGLPVIGATLTVRQNGRVVPQLIPPAPSGKNRKQQKAGAKYLETIPPQLDLGAGGEFEITVEREHFQTIAQTVNADPGTSHSLKVILAEEDEWADPPKTFPNLHHAFFLNNAQGWIAGDHVLLVTRNGGAAWRMLNTTPERLHFKNIWFGDPENGWGLEHNGTIHFTSDGGVSWAKYNPNPRDTAAYIEEPFLDNMEFIPEGKAWVLSKNRLFLLTDPNEPLVALPPITNASGTICDVVSFHYDRNNHGWAVAVGGDDRRWSISQFQDGAWTNKWSTGPFQANSVVFLQHAYDDVLIARTQDNRLFTLGPNRDVEPAAPYCLSANVHKQVMLWSGHKTMTGRTAVYHQLVGDFGTPWMVMDHAAALNAKPAGKTNDQSTLLDVAALKPEIVRTVQTGGEGRGWVGTESGRIYKYPAVEGTKDIWDAYSGNFLNGFPRIAQFETGPVTHILELPGEGQNTGLAAATAGGWFYRKTADQSWVGKNLEMPLQSLSLESGRLIAVAPNGETRLSPDLGRTWQAKPAYSRIPMMIYVLVGLLYAAVSVIYIRSYLRRAEILKSKIPEADPNQDFIDAVFENDQPIDDDRSDKLGFSAIAKGIVDFLANAKTLPPLTLAITGSWGTGKSSLMNLVGRRFKQRGFPVVYFNAWHHHKERHLLAALLERIRVDGVPDLFDPNRLRFRWNLFWLRSQGAKPLSALLVFVFFSWAAFLVKVEHYEDLYPPNVVQTWKRSLTAQFTDIQSVFGGKTTPSQLDKETHDAPGLFPFLSTILLIGFYLRRTLTTFGIKPSKLMAMTGASMDVKTLKEGIGFRKKFADEFNDFTTALGKKHLVIIIDDVDRCLPEQVMDVMEALNFLASCGQCYLILGIDKHKVEKCIGWSYRHIATDFFGNPEEQPEDDSDQTQDQGQSKPAEPAGEKNLYDNTHRTARAKLAREYLEKLVNIEVPIPKGDTLQMEQFLGTAPAPEDESEAAPPSLREKFVSAIHRPGVRYACILSFAAVMGISFTKVFVSPPDPQPITAPADQPQDNRDVAENTDQAGRGDALAVEDSDPITAQDPFSNSPFPDPDLDRRQQTQQAAGAVKPKTWFAKETLILNGNNPGLLIPQGVHSNTGNLMFGFGLLLILVGLPYWRPLPKPDVIRAEAALQAAIALWVPFFVAKQISPRLVKRIVNKTRFFHNISEAGAKDISIRALVSLAVIEHCYHEQGLARITAVHNWQSYWSHMEPAQAAFEPMSYAELYHCMNQMKFVIPDVEESKEGGL